MNRSSAVIAAVILLLFMFLFPYAAIIRDEAVTHGLDPALVAAVIRVESNFRPDAVSRRGARGLMQVMPATAGYILERSGRQELNDLEERLLNPRFNIELGTWYLAYLIDYYDGDITISLAAYNAGLGKVDRWLKDSTWDGTLDNSHQIPYAETKNYVQRVHYFWRYFRWMPQFWSLK